MILANEPEFEGLHLSIKWLGLRDIHHIEVGLTYQFDRLIVYFDTFFRYRYIFYLE